MANASLDPSDPNGSKKFILTQTFLNPNPDRSDISPDAFGTEIALDGDQVLIGARFDDTFGDGSGAAYLFDAATGNLTQTFSYSELDDGDTFGTGVAIDGDEVLVAASDENDFGSDGTAFLFNAANGELNQTFLNPGGPFFGASAVALEDNKVLIGAVQNNTFGEESGAAFLFDTVSGNLTQTFFDPNPNAGDNFGSSVAIDGNNLLISAAADSTLGNNSGTVFLFDAVSGNLKQTFLNPNPDADDFFGVSIDIYEDKVLIAARLDDTFGDDSGAAYLFDANTGNLLQTFSPPNPVGSEFFGVSVAIDGDKVLIGAWGDDTSGEDSGAAFLFDAVSGNLIQSFFEPNPRADSVFGFSVAIDGDSLLIGAPGPSEGENDSGIVYLFEPITLNIIEGTSGKDVLVGTADNDHILGLSGKDLLIGKAGNDILEGGVGKDKLFGSRGDDILDGGADNDLLLGGRGNDKFVLRKGDGLDKIFDYRDGVDSFLLADNLAFEDLTITQSLGRSVISITDTNEDLAVLFRVNANDIGAEDFSAVP